MSARERPGALLLACVAASVAAALAATALTRSEGATAPAPSAAEPGLLAALERRVARLEAAAERNAAPHAARAAAPGPDAVRSPVAPAADADALERLAQRLAALERAAAAAELPGGSTPMLAPEVLAASMQRPLGAEELAAVQRTILDPASTDATKAAAHARLRRVENAYTPAVLGELVRLGTTSPDPAVRASVWLAFDGATPVPEIVPSLLLALGSDAVARPREEAADALGNYLDQPGVTAALERAAAQDPDDRVRRKARRELDAGSPRPTQR